MSGLFNGIKSGVNTITAPVQGLVHGDPLYNRVTSGKWDFNPDSMVNKATNNASKNDSIHRALGISDSSFGKGQRVSAGAAGLFFGGEALAPYVSGSGSASSAGSSGGVGSWLQLLSHVQGGSPQPQPQQPDTMLQNYLMQFDPLYSEAAQGGFGVLPQYSK